MSKGQSQSLLSSVYCENILETTSFLSMMLYSCSPTLFLPCPAVEEPPVQPGWGTLSLAGVHTTSALSSPFSLVSDLEIPPPIPNLFRLHGCGQPILKGALSLDWFTICSYRHEGLFYSCQNFLFSNISDFLGFTVKPLNPVPDEMLMDKTGRD